MTINASHAYRSTPPTGEAPAGNDGLDLKAMLLPKGTGVGAGEATAATGHSAGDQGIVDTPTAPPCPSGCGRILDTYA
mgnify:CR=1 FL=1